MGPPIAIAGSPADTSKEELGLVDPDTERQAAEAIGRELADAGCRIPICSAQPKFIESDVVRGYVASTRGGAAPLGSATPSPATRDSVQSPIL